MSTSPVDVVLRWLEAVNAGDVERVLALTAADVRLVGPRGIAVGHPTLRQWLTHAGASFATHAVYARGPAVVVAQQGVWRDEAGAVRGTADVATRFRVAGHRVAELQRYDGLAEALGAAGLAASDEALPSGERAIEGGVAAAMGAAERAAAPHFFRRPRQLNWGVRRRTWEDRTPNVD